MKININTKEKLIRLEESTNLGELFTQLEESLPNMKWREYTLEVTITNNWNYPTFSYEPFSPTVPYPNYPWITYTT